MHFFGTKDKPPLYAGIAAVSLMILTGLTFAGTAVVLTVTMSVFVVLSPILVPAAITSSFLATGFLASGSLGASGIALLVWLYKKEEHFRNTLHAGGVRPEGANKLAGGGKGSRGENPSEKDKPPERDKLPGRDKPAKEGKLLKVDKPVEKDEPPGEDKPAEEDKPPQKYKSEEGDKPAEEDKPLGVKHVSIAEISKVMLVEQNPIGPKCCGPSTSSTKRSHQFQFAMDATKVRSSFMKEYQKVPRVGAFAYKYFTSRDKKYINHIHI